MSISKKDGDYESFLIKLVSNAIKKTLSLEKKLVSRKKNGSELTLADIFLNKMICSALTKFNKSIPIISEENHINSTDFLNKRYWLIDPIDGTKNYINGGNEYTINIALIENGTPVLGIIGHPPTKKIWFGSNKKAFLIKANGVKTSLINKKCILQNPVLITSRYEANHLKIQSFLESNRKIEIKKVSSSLKFCILAEKNAHFYPRFTKISKWDIAAGHAVLKATGGEIKDLKNENYSYNYNGSHTKEFTASISSEWTSYFRKLSSSNFL
ncbi:hypothetical protein OA264_01535 [Alphaproteobacteria bacterium]|nr:hypothetical protein [Alphaproteobacteria bacterium]